MKIENGRCVYLMFNPLTKLTKIGVSDNVEARKTSLEMASGCRLEIIYTTKHLLCGEKYEADAHKALSQYRVLGEWFNLPSHKDAIATIESLVSSATEDLIVENYKKGMSISNIARDYEVTRQAILARLKKYGVYDANGHIYERDPLTINPNSIIKPKANTVQHISTIDDAFDDLTYLDGEIPELPLKNLKRLEPNINYNGEWYQISIFRANEFIYSYTRDINKARAYLQGIKTVDFAKTVISHTERNKMA